MSFRASGLARLVSYGQHGSDTTCHTLFRENGNEASIRVLRSNWVVVIGLELLSLACPDLGLGSDIVTSFMLVSPCYCYGYLILLVWRIGFGVTGMELVGVMPTVQGFVWCDVGSLWLVSIPKSKDWFME
jgi:hypothetical protein